MKNRFMRALLAVFCTIAIAMNAATVHAASGHSCVAIRAEFVGLNSYADNGENHKQYGYYVYRCQICGGQMRIEYSYGPTEAHRYNGPFTDLGHGDMSHDYTVRCGNCSHTARTSIPCDYKTKGYHNTPY